MRRWVWSIGVICLVAWTVVRASPPEGSSDGPRFTARNELIRPEGYREWIFIGASLGLSYNEGTHQEQRFHNLYLNRKAYQEYKQSGRFPEKSIIVMEVLTPASQVSINRNGQFEDQSLGIEAAVKDTSRFREGWAYFSFTRPGQPATAPAFPKEACWDCHHAHGETDNVFTQFYPVLRRGKKAAAAGSPANGSYPR